MLLNSLAIPACLCLILAARILWTHSHPKIVFDMYYLFYVILCCVSQRLRSLVRLMIFCVKSCGILMKSYGIESHSNRIFEMLWNFFGFPWHRISKRWNPIETNWDLTDIQLLAWIFISPDKFHKCLNNVSRHILFLMRSPFDRKGFLLFANV